MRTGRQNFAGQPSGAGCCAGKLAAAEPGTARYDRCGKAAPFAAGHGAPYGPEHAAEPAEDAVFAALPDVGPLPQEKLERSEAVRCLLAAMQALEETDRAILQLQYGQGMTGAQIAAALGLHAATVRQRSRRARQKLKQLLEQEGLTL